MKKEYNAFVQEDVSVKATGNGRLSGLTFTVKDVFAIQDYTSGAGNPDWLRTHEPANQHAPVIDRLLKDGATLKGAAHTDELMYSLNGENVHYGTPVNPKAPDRLPGGSSSGSAVAVAAGLVDFSLGTDTGGSVRVPSSYCGIYGLRPTHGAVSAEGVIPLAKSFDTVGWMARDPELLLKVGDLLLDHQSEETTFSDVFLGADAWELLTEDSRGAFDKVLSSVKASSKNNEWVRISDEGLSSWAEAFRAIQGLEIWSEHGEWIEKEEPRFGPGIAERFAWTSTLKKDENSAAFLLRDEVRQSMATLLGENGLLIIPTAPGAAPLLNLHGEEAEQYRANLMQLSCIAGLAGLPQVTLPLIEVNGLPVGLSVIAGRYQDMNLLRWANRFVADYFSN